MKTRLLAILLIACLSLFATAQAQVDYALLDDMSLEALEALNEEVAARISAMTAQAARDAGILTLESAGGTITYAGFVMNDQNFKVNGSDTPVEALVIMFDYTNKEDAEKQLQSDFWIKAYQNGTEMDTPNSWSVTDTLPAEIDNYYKSVLKGGTVSAARAFVPTDDSPVTVIVNAQGASSAGETASMELDFRNTPQGKAELAAQAAEPTQESAVEGAEPAAAESQPAKPIVIYGSYEALDIGSRGEEVRSMQQALIDQGFLNGKADGDYGKGTAGAVSSFQESVGLEATGTADEATLQKLYGGLDVRAALLEETWFFNGGSDIALNALQFAEDSVRLTQITFDGNGISVNAENDFPYSLSGDGIVITLFDGSEMNIAFAAEGSQLVLNAHEYWSLAEVDAALQGYWVSAYTDFGFKYEDHVQFSEGKIRSERANEGAGLSKGEYYYAGPYDGTYSLGLGSIETDMFKGKAYGFNIIGGKPTLMRYTHVYQATTQGFPGQNGYKF